MLIVLRFLTATAFEKDTDLLLFGESGSLIDSFFFFLLARMDLLLAELALLPLGPVDLSDLVGLPRFVVCD
jgi:hypothetical protein